MRIKAAVSVLAVMMTAGACSQPGSTGPTGSPASPSTPERTTSRPKPVSLPADNPRLTDVVPAPLHVKEHSDENFRLNADTAVVVPDTDKAAHAAGEFVADKLRGPTGFKLPVTGRDQSSAIDLTVDPAAHTGAQGYRLDVTRERIRITAHDADGLFNGAQTLRQLLPADVEHTHTVHRPWVVAGGTVTDRPQYRYRGAMLDVARHFFGPDTVKRYIDRIAQYKVNYLHLHLADDQGWRLQIDGWPKLTSVGSKTQVGGGRGGFYTQEQYRQIVAYAQARGVTIVPEIDMPGHTNAALTSYPKLACKGTHPTPYTGTQVGFSTLCVDSKDTYRFVHDVVTQLAELTPGKYLHIGGDEAKSTSDAEYKRFFTKVLPMVTAAGKTPLGWNEYAKGALPKGAALQYWGVEGSDPSTSKAAAKGHQVLMSPANKAYIDMKYDPSDTKGNKWAGPVSVKTAYSWDPAATLSGVGGDAVLGVEAPLWTELVETDADIDRQAFPRIAAIAEVGWSRKRDWPDFRRRLAAQGPRMDAQGIGYHRSADIPWR